ncbi:MAG: alpha/beta fold hydrolase [Chloroflexota bacterium]
MLAGIRWTGRSPGSRLPVTISTVVNAPPVRFARSVDGSRLAWTALGSGPPLVIVPGGPWATIQTEWSVPAWRRWYERLAERLTVIRYDARGTGLSAGGTADFRLHTQRDDICSVMEAVSTGPIALFAPRYAGPWAIAAAVHRPQRVSHLILWCCPGPGTAVLAQPRSTAMHALAQTDARLFLQTLTHDRIGWSHGEVANDLTAALGETLDPAVLARFHQDAAATRFDALLPQVRVPTLVLQRRELAEPDVVQAAELASAIPGATLKVIEGESVAPFLGQSDETTAAILSLLGQPDTPPTAACTGPAEPLSAREIEVLRLLAEGTSNVEIAERLVISPSTVKTHLSNLYGKLGVGSRARAVARGRSLGLVD